jgi:hypothetical protein
LKEAVSERAGIKKVEEKVDEPPGPKRRAG